MTAVGPQELHRQLADQTQANYDDRFSQRWLRQPQTLQSNGSHCSERRGIETNFPWQTNTKILRDRENFGVRGIAYSGASDAIADAQICDAFTDLNYGTGGA